MPKTYYVIGSKLADGNLDMGQATTDEKAVRNTLALMKSVIDDADLVSKMYILTEVTE